MGGSHSKKKKESRSRSQSFSAGHQSGSGFAPASSRPAKFAPILDNFRSLEEVQQALRQAGLESSNLIIAVDFTKSNTWTGEQTFGGKCLHDVSTPTLNPYQSVIRVVGGTLAAFDDDNLIPSFGFGDILTKDQACFPFFPDRPCYGFGEVLTRYNHIATSIQLSGPTNFAPVIYEAIRITQRERGYHILVIIADGQVTSYKETVAAIVEASKYALSIVCIGVGDGPWEMMEEFDDQLPQRVFDNFQFVDYNSVLRKHPRNQEPAFALAALMEIPEQFREIQRLGYL